MIPSLWASRMPLYASCSRALAADIERFEYTGSCAKVATNFAMAKGRDHHSILSRALIQQTAPELPELLTVYLALNNYRTPDIKSEQAVKVSIDVGRVLEITGRYDFLINKSTIAEFKSSNRKPVVHYLPQLAVYVLGTFQDVDVENPRIVYITSEGGVIGHHDYLKANTCGAERFLVKVLTQQDNKSPQCQFCPFFIDKRCVAT